MSNLTYLQGYPEQLLSQVRTLINEQRLGDVLAKRYPGTHDYATDKALWQYTQDLKNALGLHTAVSRVQGGKLKAKAEIRVATVFRNAPEPFLRMIVVHELAHLKEKEHNKAFYQLCCHMEPQYHQLEFDTRLWLTQLSLGQDKI